MIPVIFTHWYTNTKEIHIIRKMRALGGGGEELSYLYQLKRSDKDMNLMVNSIILRFSENS